MDPQELVPLEAGIPPTPRRRQSRYCIYAGSRDCYKGPLKLCRLIVLVIMLPAAFIMVPLYMRYRVFSGQMYPMSMTDMRLIDGKISPTWCQRQVVRSNTTMFNAFVVPSAPQLSSELVPVTMTRELELADDMKEYWGFYLLKGSSVTVAACSRWPGASLIMIKGYKHLQECAYIGDDSSEELDELLEAHQLGLLSNTTLMEKLLELKKKDGKTNHPDTMKRHKAGVSFHDKSKTNNLTSQDTDVANAADEIEHDPKELREILEHLHALRQAVKDEQLKYYKPPSHLMSLPALHRHRDTNVDRDERKWLFFRDIDGNTSQWKNNIDKAFIHQLTTLAPTKPTMIQVDNIITKTNIVKDVKSNYLRNDNKGDMITESNKVIEVKTNYLGSENKEHIITKSDEAVKGSNDLGNDKKEDITIESNKVVEVKTNYLGSDKSDETKVAMNKTDGEKTGKDELNIILPITRPISEDNQQKTAEQSSKEVFEDVLKRLQSLGGKGKRVLEKLHQAMGVDYSDQNTTTTRTNIMAAVQGSDEELDRLRKILVEAIDEEKSRPQRQQKRREARADARAKRDLMLGQIELRKELNEDDEPRNLAAEEGLEPDGYADHHETVNETTPFDMSNSEFWSSFSSSEEALLECEGLILNLPLTPHSDCRAGVSEAEANAAARSNALTYRVPANGYYFFVFNSENEVQVNFIRARFDLQKTRYDVARTKLRECTNTTDRCDLSLDIFSSQRVILEVPLRNNDSLWNEQFVIISECEPRTSIYLACVIAVPILILMFAFQ